MSVPPPPWVDAASGVVAALVALLLTYPMDVHKTRQQASVHVVAGFGDDAENGEEVLATRRDHETTSRADCTRIDDEYTEDDVIRRKQQQQRQQQQLRNISVSHWFAGWQTKVLHTTASNFCYFYLYGSLLSLYKKRNRSRRNSLDGAASAKERETKISSATHLLLSMAAASLNTLITLPLDVVSSRQQVGGMGTTNTSLSNTDGCSNCDEKVALRAIVAGGGNDKAGGPPTIQQLTMTPPRRRRISDLWRGLVPSLVLCINPAIHYTTYDALKDYWLEWRRRRKGVASSRQLNVIEAFVLGVVAKFVATIATYPLIRAKVLLMVGGRHASEADEEEDRLNPSVNTSLSPSSGVTELLQCLVDDYQRNAIKGWYAGCTLQLLHTLIKSALLMAVKERIERTSSEAWAAWLLARRRRTAVDRK